MDLTLVPAINVARKVIFPATAERMVAISTRCSMEEVATASNTTLAMVMVAVTMMDGVASTMQLLALKNLIALTSRQSISQSQLPVFEKARKGVWATSISLSRCMILVLVMAWSLLLPPEEVASVARVGDEADEAGVAAVAVDVVMVEMMEAMEEISAMKTFPLQQLKRFPPSLLKVIGRMLEIARLRLLLRLRLTGRHSSSNRLALFEACTLGVRVAGQGLNGLCIITTRTTRLETKY